MAQAILRSAQGVGRAALALAVVLLPLVFATAIVYQQASRKAEEDAQVAAAMVLQHAESIVSYASQATNELLTMAGMPCENVSRRLLEIASYRPYFRSILLLDGNEVYCSSSAGSRKATLRILRLEDLFKPIGAAFYMVPGTFNVPERPALVFVRSDVPGRGVVLYVDSRYLYDTMSAVGGILQFAVRLQVDDTTVSGGVESWAEYRSALGVEHTQSIHKGKISVTVGVPQRAMSAYRRTLWLSFLPFAVLASAVLAYLAFLICRRRTSLPEDIKRGMRRGEFYVCYQPIVDLANGRCLGAEALMRWSHPSGQEMRPDTFFAVADESNLTIPLTRHLFDLIEKDVAFWIVPPEFRLSVNIAAQHLASNSLIDDITQLLATIRATASVLVLEITERNVVPDDDTVAANMSALRALGVRFAIDDFGTGHSALSYLERLPVDYLKIDRSFVSAIDTDAVTAPVLDSIIALAKRLGLIVVAEGIETETQASYLRERGVDKAQGYLYARPMRASDFKVWIRNRLVRTAIVRVAGNS